MSKASLRDVAERAGVSPSTVARAFTRPDMVSDQTRQRVLDAAGTLDFTISRSASALKSGQTYRIALLINEHLANWFNASVYEGLNSVLLPQGYDIAVYQQIDDSRRRERFFSELPIRRNADAVIVASFGMDDKKAERLKKIGVPIVGINVPSIVGLDSSISIDDYEGEKIAVRHLQSLGHENIAYVCGQMPSSLPYSIDLRRKGFIDAFSQVDSPARSPSILESHKDSSYAKVLGQLFSLSSFPTAICCQADDIALSLQYMLLDYGYRAPEDYSIIGFDDSNQAETRGLTTIHQDPRAMGVIAAKKTLALIKGEKLENPYETVVPSLALRSTTGPRMRSRRNTWNIMETESHEL